MLFGDLLHDLHRQLIMICSDVCGGKDWRKLMLSRRDLIVLGLGQNAELPEFGI